MRCRARLAAVAAALLLGGAAGAAEIDLATLESWAIQAAPELRLARAQADIELQRLDVNAASLGPRLSGSAGLGAVRDVVSEDASYNARRLNGQVAVRWPLAGKAEAQRRERKEIEAAVTRARLRVEQVRRDVLRQLRSAYAEHAAARQQARLAEAYLSWQQSTLPALNERRQAGLLLEADRLGHEVVFTSARTTHARQLLRAKLARGTLERLTGHTLGDLSATPPAVPTQCLRDDVLSRAADERPDIASASTDVQLRRELREVGEYEGLDAGVTLAQNVARDIGSRTGWNTSIGLDASLPLNWREQRDAEAGRRRIELALAEELLGIRRADDQRQTDALLDTVALRRRESLSAADRVLSAMEVWRVARLQAERIAGDPLERALQTRLTLFHAGIDLSETELRRWVAELEGPALAPDCLLAAAPTEPAAPAAPAASANQGPDDSQTRLEQLADVFERMVTDLNRPRRQPGERAPATPAPGNTPSKAAGPSVAGSAGRTATANVSAVLALSSVRAGTAPAPLDAAICPSGSDGTAPIEGAAAGPGVAAPAIRLSWFVWDSASLLAAPEQLAGLPTSSERIWLSFSAEQTARLDGPALVGDIRRFIDAARACGLQVELLFGDPDAVRPQSRGRIIATLDRLMALGFSGLVLDLERDQLPEADRAQWAPWSLALLRDWRAANTRPLALVTHYRDLASSEFVQALQNVGVTELVPMIYIADTAAAAAQAAPVLAAAGSLPVTLAQSIEATLPPSESVHRLGRAAALSRWQALAQALSAGRSLRAVAVQSFEDYLRSTP